MTKDKAKRNAQQRRYYRRKLAEGATFPCARCGSLRVHGLRCKVCWAAYLAGPGKEGFLRAKRRYNARCRAELSDSYLKVLKRDWPGLPPDVAELVRLGVRLKRAAGLVWNSKKEGTTKRKATTAKAAR